MCDLDSQDSGINSYDGELPQFFVLKVITHRFLGILLKDFWKPLGNYRRGNSAFDIIPPTIQLTTSVGTV